MANGTTHTAITIAAAGVTTYVMLKAGASPEAIRITVAGCISGTILSPDLDVDAGFIGHKWVEKYFGKIAASAWRVLWWPYAKLIPHRSWISHAPVISTLLRTGYWYSFYWLLCALFGFSPYVPSAFVAGSFLGGLMVSDILHFLTDILSSQLKRRSNARIYFPMSEMFKRGAGRTRNRKASS